MTRRFGLLLAMVAIMTASAMAMGAQTAFGQSISFSITPAHGSPKDAAKGAYFVYTLQAGQTIKDEATVSNSGAQPVSLKLYAADAITASGGGTAFAASGAEPTGARKLVVPSQNEVVLAPGASVSVPFTVTLPADTRPGDHVAGLIVEAPPKEGAAGGSVQALVVERVGVAVVVRVPGDFVNKISFGSFCMNQQSGSNYFQVLLMNEGNVLTKGTGTFTLETDKGQRVFERPVDLGSVMPGDKTVVRVHAPQYAPPGNYVAKIALQPSEGSAASAQSKIRVPEQRVNGCGADIDQPAANVPDETANDNFNIPLAGNITSGGSWVVLGLGLLVLLLGATVVAMLLKGRSSNGKGSVS